MNANTEKKKVALIFGITGQTGSYLTEILLSKNYDVHGVIRRASIFNTERLDHIFETIRKNLHYGDILDSLSVMTLIQNISPDEIYNLAAQSHVQVSFEMPVYTTCTDALGTLNILESIRILKKENKIKVFQASTSEMFGGDSRDYDKQTWSQILDEGMNEKTPFFPKSPYGAAKLYAHHLVRIYRESFRMFICSAICFNHESERRDPRFVTRKVTRAVARIYHKKDTELHLGNLDAQRDWGYANDYAQAIFKIVQHDVPLDFVIATGKTYTIRYLVEVAFKTIGIDIGWKGEHENEVGIDLSNGKELVKIDSVYYRPNEVHYLKGNASMARDILDWKPSVHFEEMIANMVRHDLVLEDPNYR